MDEPNAAMSDDVSVYEIDRVPTVMVMTFPWRPHTTWYVPPLTKPALLTATSCDVMTLLSRRPIAIRPLVLTFVTSILQKRLFL